MLLLYVDNVLLFVNTLGDAQKLIRELEEFHMHTKLSVNSSKTKDILVKSQIFYLFPKMRRANLRKNHALRTIVSY